MLIKDEVVQAVFVLEGLDLGTKINSFLMSDMSNFKDF